MSGDNRRVTLRFLAAPLDANTIGRVGAGNVMEWIDKAGYACALGWAGTYAVTAYVGNVRFQRPVKVGDMVEVQANVVLTGRTSMQVVCTVSSGDPRGGERRVNTVPARVRGHGRGRASTPVPEFTPATEWEIDQHARAHPQRGAGQDRADMARQTYPDQTESCRETLRFLSAPTDVNWGGKVHGGYVMDWIAQGARLVAERWHGGDAVAVYAGGVRFYQPMFVGDLVEVDARLIYTGFSSMHVSVHVRSGDPRTGELTTTTHCTMVYVALDEDGAKTPVRSWNPQLPQDRDLQEHAKKLIHIREQLLRPVPDRMP